MDGAIMVNSTLPQQEEDHRVLSGRKKRERMRTHLLSAVLSTYPTKSLNSRTVINDVIKTAGVSRGTFYKYFDSIEDAVGELASTLADELAESYTAVYESVTDPRIRTAIGCQIYLSRSALEPKWGAFVSRLNYVTRDSGMLTRVRSDIQSGIDIGVFQITDMDATLDMVIGAVVEGVRHVSRSPNPRLYIEAMAGLMLRSFGIPADDADVAVAAAAAQLREGGNSGRLSWWSEIPE